jgi:NADH:ubiquinone oxidoreductase subunit 4 (subunit M)
MYNRIAFAGSYFQKFWGTYIPDINKREFHILLTLVIFTVTLGIYPSIIFDGLHYASYCVLYTFDSTFNTSINLDTFIIKDNIPLKFLPDFLMYFKN